MQSNAKAEDWQVKSGTLDTLRKPLQGNPSPLHPINIAKGRLASARMNLKQAKYELLLSEERVYKLEQQLKSPDKTLSTQESQPKSSVFSGFKWSLPLLGKKPVQPAANLNNNPIQKENLSPNTNEEPTCFQLSWKTVNASVEVHTPITIP